MQGRAITLVWDTQAWSNIEQNRTEVYLKIPKGINATRIYKHNITQCTNIAVDGVVIKCSRICNKHTYFVSVVEKVNFFYIIYMSTKYNKNISKGIKVME